MTGYGKATAVYNGKKINIEIKSLNSKALDLSTRIASLYREKEIEIRALIATTLERGKVDFSLWIEKDENLNATPINGALLENYYKQIQTISSERNIPLPNDWFATLLRLPDVLTRAEVEELTDEEWITVKKGIEEALQKLVDFRKQEGAALYKKFSEKLDNISALLKSIEPYEKSRTEKIRQRIIDGLNSIPEVEYDREEKQRLANHLKYFKETMDTGHGQGKKLGFIAQEMGREINTTGSKSNQAEMQQIVVKMKDELEQIKEQVLNVM